MFSARMCQGTKACSCAYAAIGHLVPTCGAQTMQTYAETIDDILDDFDFDKLHSCMKAMRWEWDANIPTAEMLEAQGRMLLETLSSEPDTVEIEVGGLRARRQFMEGMEELTLSFEIRAASRFREIH
jgi:hypothetical protein